MKRTLLAAALAAFGATTADAGVVDLQLSATTDGNRYHQIIDAAGNLTDTTEFNVGALQLTEGMGFSFDIQGTDSRVLDTPSGLRYHEFNTMFTPSHAVLGSGLLLSDLVLNFTPSSEEIHANASASMQWSETHGGGGFGVVLFQLGINWIVSGMDASGAFHHLSYNRSYDFMNYNLISSVDALTVFTEDLFAQLMADTGTQYSFTESVYAMTMGCTEPDVCGANGVRHDFVAGTFSFEQISVPTPHALWLMGLGVLFVRRRHA